MKLRIPWGVEVARRAERASRARFSGVSLGARPR
jgi:hypothetical protein